MKGISEAARDIDQADWLILQLDLGYKKRVPLKRNLVPLGSHLKIAATQKSIFIPTRFFEKYKNFFFSLLFFFSHYHDDEAN